MNNDIPGLVDRLSRERERMAAFDDDRSYLNDLDLHEIITAITTLTAERDELVEAIRALNVDKHQFQTRPCATCRRITNAMKSPFGCDDLALEINKGMHKL